MAMMKTLGTMVLASMLLTACGATTSQTARFSQPTEIAWDEISVPQNINYVYSSNLIQSGAR
jgi:outer membrane biogenesis lipoprotein LolB